MVSFYYYAQRPWRSYPNGGLLARSVTTSTTTVFDEAIVDETGDPIVDRSGDQLVYVEVTVVEEFPDFSQMPQWGYPLRAHPIYALVTAGGIFPDDEYPDFVQRPQWGYPLRAHPLYALVTAGGVISDVEIIHQFLSSPEIIGNPRLRSAARTYSVVDAARNALLDDIVRNDWFEAAFKVQNHIEYEAIVAGDGLEVLRDIASRAAQPEVHATVLITFVGVASGRLTVSLADLDYMINRYPVLHSPVLPTLERY